MRNWFALILVALLVASTAGAQSSHDPFATASTSTPDIFATFRSQWARNLHEKRIDASVVEYAPDADFIDPNGARISGTQAIRRLFETVTTTYDSDIAFTSKRVVQSGNLGFDSGTYDETLIVRATGKTQHAVGSYLTIYQRGPTGEWLIVQQIWTGAVN
jgi:ketosteroid isomerase-like protein